MLEKKAGISRVKKLYLQLLYRCNFNCQHCFHGERLMRKDEFSFENACRLLEIFQDEYSITNVTLLGGEPFIHRNITEIISFSKALGLQVDICTNGYRIEKKLRKSASKIDNLRISLEGLEKTNDQIRRQGSFAAAIKTLGIANELGVDTSVTMTVNAKNFREVIPLAKVVSEYGVKEVKLHCLRAIGNVLSHEDLIVQDSSIYDDLVEEILKGRESSPIPILMDEDLDPKCSVIKNGKRDQDELERVEVQPNGELYISCKAVGDDSNAFVYDKEAGDILYQPKRNDELELHTPQVHYTQI